MKCDFLPISSNRCLKQTPNKHLKAQIKSIKSFLSTCCITPKRVTSWRGPSLPHCTCEQLGFFRRNAAAVASRWQHCVQFDRPEVWNSDLPLQKRTRYRSTNWPVLVKTDFLDDFYGGIILLKRRVCANQRMINILTLLGNHKFWETSKMPTQIDFLNCLSWWNCFC